MWKHLEGNHTGKRKDSAYFNRSQQRARLCSKRGTQHICPVLSEFLHSHPREEAEAEVSGKRRVRGEKRKQGSGRSEGDIESCRAIVMKGDRYVGAQGVPVMGSDPGREED